MTEPCKNCERCGDAKDAELARLRAELDLVKTTQHDNYMNWLEQRNKAMDEADRLRACLAEVEADCAYVSAAKGAAPWRKRQADRTSAILYRHASVAPDFATTQQVTYRDSNGRGRK